MADAVKIVEYPVVTYGYDPLGNVTSVTDQLGNATTYRYDALSRQTHVIDALSTDPQAANPDHSVVTTYDNRGNVAAVTDQLGRTTDYTYDHL